MKFIVSALITLSAVGAFATETSHTATTTKETTTTAAPAAHVAPAHTTTNVTKETKKEASKADMCAKLTDAKAKSDCEKKAVHKM